MSSVDRRQDWRFVTALLFTSATLEMTAWSHLSAFTPLYLERELHLGAAEQARWVGLLAATSLFVALPLAPFWGVIADRYSRKAVLARSLLVEAIGYAIGVFASDLGHLVAQRLVLGLSFGNAAVAIATLSLIVPERRVATAIGFLQTAFAIGPTIGPLLGSALIGLVGLRGMFAVDCALALTALTLQLLFLREPVEHDRTTSFRGKLGLTFHHVLHRPTIRWNFALFFLFTASVLAVDPYLPLLIARLYDGENVALVIGLVLSAGGVLAALLAPVLGRLGDRLGHTRVITAGAVVLCGALLGLSLAGSLLVAAPLALVRALHVPLAAVQFANLTRAVEREHRATVLALVPLMRNAASLSAPLLAAALAVAGLAPVFQLGAAFAGGAVVASGLLARAWRPARSDQPAP